MKRFSYRVSLIFLFAFGQFLSATPFEVTFLPQLHLSAADTFDKTVIYNGGGYRKYMASQTQIFNYLAAHKQERQVVFHESQFEEISAATMASKKLPGVTCDTVAAIFFGISQPMKFHELSEDQQRVLFYLGGAKIALCLGYVERMPKTESKLQTVIATLKSWWIIISADLSGRSTQLALRQLEINKNDKHIVVDREKYSLAAIARYMSDPNTPPDTKPILIYEETHDFAYSKGSFELQLKSPVGFCEALASITK